MPFNIPDLDPIAVAILVAVGIYSWLHFRRTRAAATPVAAPERGLAYEAHAEPLTRAKAAFREKFPEVETLPGVAGAPNGVQLVRFGLFNVGREALDPARVRRPVTLHFAKGVEVLHASFAESLKTTAPVPPPEVDGSTVRLPTGAVPPGGTLIYNIVTRGKGMPDAVDAEIDGIATIRRFG